MGVTSMVLAVVGWEVEGEPLERVGDGGVDVYITAFDKIECSLSA